MTRCFIWGLLVCSLLVSVVTGGEATSKERPFVVNDAPFPFRGILAFCTVDPNNPLDRQFYRQKLAQWSGEGYNAVIWFGMHELTQGYHRLIRLKEFPEARELNTKQNEHCIEEMRWVFRTAKEAGLDNFLYTLSIYMTEPFAKAHGYDKKMPVSATVTPSHNQSLGKIYCGVRDEWTRKYVESLFAEFPQVYADLDGFYSPLGEAVPGNRASFFREAIAPGLKRSERRAVIIAHQWQVPIEDYLRDVVSKEAYDNVWLGFHTYNAEQITDAKPYPCLTEWMERTKLPTVVAIYPANILNFPFNSPRFAYEIVTEMKKQQGYKGYYFWEMSRVQMSGLFRHALAYYGSNREKYTDERWLKKLEEQFGSAESAKHFLEAFDISARIIPEFCALVYHGADVQRRELRLPYRFMTGNNGPDSWMSSPVRGKVLIPIPIYARFAADNPERFRGRNGSKKDYQEAIWSSQGGSVFDIIPEMHMETIRQMGECCLASAEKAMKYVTKNQDEAKRTFLFMKTYKLLTTYYDLKVRAAISALIYARTHKAKDKVEAEDYADRSLAAYEEVARVLIEQVNPLNKKMIGFELAESGVKPDELLEMERKERKQLGQIFGWPD